MSPALSLHPCTPVVVGVGQVTVRPDPDLDPAERPEPVELMALALEAAAEDVDGVTPGGPAPPAGPSSAGPTASGSCCLSGGGR
jgi:hypothetical protein